MDFDNSDNKTIIGIIIIICLILLVIGFTFFAVNKKVAKSEQSHSSYRKIDNNATTKTLTEEELNKLNLSALQALYNYTQVEGDLTSYLNNLNNNQKLYLGDIMRTTDNKKLSMLEVKKTLTHMFGSDLNVSSEDYYLTNSEVPFILYDKSAGTFSINSSYEDESGTISPIGTKSIYNYKVKEIINNNNEYSITVYGLYKNNENFMEYLENDTGLKRYININDNLEEFGYQETEEVFLENLFNNDLPSFKEFKYIYTLEDNTFILKDFVVIR